MHSDALSSAQHAAELAGLAAFARAVMARAVEHDPSIVALRVDCAAPGADGPGQFLVAEFIDAHNVAVAGFAL